MSIRYTPETAVIEIDKMIERREKYNSKHAGEESTEWARSINQDEIINLQAIKRRLELTNDITMNFIAEDIMEKILAVRKDNMADKFVGIIVYYELKPRYQWNDDGTNAVACVSNVKGWPYGEGKEGQAMTDLGDGRFVADSDRPMPGCWVLGGQYVPINVESTQKGGLK